MDANILAVPSRCREAVSATCIAYEIEQHIQLDRGIVEIGKFHWSSPIEFEVHSRKDRVAFNLALSTRPSEGKIIPLDGPKSFHQECLDRLILLNPGSAYRLVLPAGKVRTLYCEIAPWALKELVTDPTNLGGQSWQTQSRARMPVMELLLNRIYEELREENFASKQALDAYLRALCVELARCLRLGNPENAGMRKGGLAPWRMRLLHQRIYADSSAPNLPELAELCGMTVRQLSRAFREETGKALGGYVVDATIERAVLLLTRTDLPITQISRKLGFASSTSFSFAFRRSTGMAPCEARRRAAMA